MGKTNGKWLLRLSDQRGNDLPSLHLFTNEDSVLGPFRDIEFIRRFKRSLRDSLATVRATISPAAEVRPEDADLLNAIPEAYISGMICLKNRLLELKENRGAKLFLLNAPYNAQLSARFLDFLGRVLATEDRVRTLLVDGNLRFGSLHELFDLPQGEGLVDYLADCEYDRPIIHRTALRNVFVVPKGHASAGETAPLLASPRLKFLTQALKNHFDLILVDSAPCDRYGDVFTLCENLRPSFLLVLAEHADIWDRLPEVRQQLERLDVEIIAVKINDGPRDDTG